MGRRHQRLHSRCGMPVKLVLFLMSAAVFAAALLTGPPSFDSTDGAEFALCGSRLETAHAPGYPLFLMIVRIASMTMSPLYGHLRLINCLLGALLVPLGAWAFRVAGASPRGAAAAAFLFATMEVALKFAGSTFNSLQLTFLRFFIGGLFLLPFALRDLKSAPRHPLRGLFLSKKPCASV